VRVSAEAAPYIGRVMERAAVASVPGRHKSWRALLVMRLCARMALMLIRDVQSVGVEPLSQPE
jgi:hypothetical protein